MDRKPQSSSQVREALRTLAAEPPTSAGELAHLQRASLLLALHIQGMPGLATGMPEIAWHFLSDADIRYKSPEYADAQTSELLSALGEWESEEP